MQKKTNVQRNLSMWRVNATTLIVFGIIAFIYLSDSSYGYTSVAKAEQIRGRKLLIEENDSTERVDDSASHQSNNNSKEAEAVDTAQSIQEQKSKLTTDDLLQNSSKQVQKEAKKEIRNRIPDGTNTKTIKITDQLGVIDYHKSNNVSSNAYITYPVPRGIPVILPLPNYLNHDAYNNSYAATSLPASNMPPIIAYLQLPPDYASVNHNSYQHSKHMRGPSSAAFNPSSGSMLENKLSVDSAWEERGRAVIKELYAEHKVEEDMKAIDKLINFSCNRLEMLKNEGRDMKPYFKLTNSLCSVPIVPDDPNSSRVAFSSSSNLTKEDFFRSLQSAVKYTRQKIVNEDPEINFYMPIWDASNAHNTSINCAEQDCILTLKRIVDDEVVVLRLDADGSFLGSFPNLLSEFQADTVRIQHILKELKRVDELVQAYNRKAVETTANDLNKPQYPPKLNFFLEIVKYQTGAVAPYWLWNYNVRAYVQLSAISTFPVHSFANALKAYTGNTAFKEPIQPFVWTDLDEERGEIGIKPIFITAVQRNAREPLNAHYSEADGVCMEGIFRCAQKFEDIEKSVAKNLQFKQFVNAVGVIQHDKPWTGPANLPQLNFDVSSSTTLNFPALVEVKRPTC